MSKSTFYRWSTATQVMASLLCCAAITAAQTPSACEFPIGPDPVEDVIPIPFSKAVLDGYHIIIHGIQLLLIDILTNHIGCIERNLKGIIPNQNYSPKDFSDDEKEKYKKIIEDFYKKHSLNTEELRNFNFKVEVKKEKIKWYLELPEFLKECKKRSEENPD